jgi:hypothetical protein
MQTKLSRSISSGPKFPLALLLLGYALFDFWVPAILDLLLQGCVAEEITIPAVAAIVGCLLAQLGVVAAWGVLGVARPVTRWVSGLLAAAGMFCFVCTGAAFVTSIHDWMELLSLLLVLPLAYLGVQIPIWSMSLGWGCRLTAAGAPDAPPKQFSLRGLFVATAAVAAILGLLNLVMRSEEVINLIGLCLLGGAVWGLLAVVPCLLSAFVPKTPLRGAAFLLAYVSVLSLGIPPIALLASGVWGHGDDFIALATYTIWGATVFTSIAGTLFGSFCVLRQGGYSLRRVTREPAGSATAL